MPPAAALLQPSGPDARILTLLLVSAILLLLGLTLLAAALRVVPDYRRLVVFRLGRYLGTKGPGLVWLMPFLDQGVPVDLRARTVRVPKEPALTRDRHRVTVGLLWAYQVTDPAKSVLNVQNLDSAAQALATSALRTLVGAYNLADVNFARAEIREALEARLREAMKSWGAEVKTVEVRDILRG